MDQHYLLLTFAVSAALGVFLIVLAARIKVSAIVVLLFGGILVGGDFLDLVHANYALNALIPMTVGLILFEGGLTLDIKGFREMSKEIWRILTIGVLVTWLGSAVIIKLVFTAFNPELNFGWDFCLLAASLIIVTGPTVIGPLLRRIGVKKHLHHILHWEGVLIDPIGVFIALLCFEYYVSKGGDQQEVFLNFFGRFGTGAVVGVLFGALVYMVIKRNWIPKEYLNIFVLTSAMLNFAVADQIIHESGLLSVTIAGLILGYGNPPGLRRIVRYKVELKDLLIGMLFVYLAAQLELARFLEYGWSLLLAIVLVMFVVRPLNVFLSTTGTQLTFRDKLFLSYIAPRGIVAASMASVVALSLTQEGVEYAIFLETFTYSIIAGTVVFQGFTARLVGRMLKVLKPEPTGWIIVGAHRMGRSVAEFIRESGVDVVLLDTNGIEVRQAHRQGLEAINVDAMAVDLEQHEDLYDVGNFLALTPNENLNNTLCQRWQRLLDGNLYRWEKEGILGEVAVGRGVWKDLGLGELMVTGQDHINFRIVTAVPADYRDCDRVLLSVVDGKVVPGAPDAEGPIRMLVKTENQEESEEGALPIYGEGVMFSERTELSDLYGDMLARVHQQVPEIDAGLMLKHLMDRENEFTSLLSYGISLPHAYSDNISEPVLTVARIRQGVTCQHTGSDITLVFMLISPEDQPVKHLELLSKLAGVIGKEETRDQLFAAHDEHALFATLDRFGKAI